MAGYILAIIFKRPLNRKTLIIQKKNELKWKALMIATGRREDVYLPVCSWTNKTIN
jgi:hypothetical protein